MTRLLDASAFQTRMFVSSLPDSTKFASALNLTEKMLQSDAQEAGGSQ